MLFFQKKPILAVDCFNLIYKFPELEEMIYRDRLDEAKSGILNILWEYQVKAKNTKIHAFFDGSKTKGDPATEDFYKGIFTYYSQEKKADDLLKKFVRFHVSPSLLTVVSSDKEIIAYCKKFKCKSQKSEDFAVVIANFLCPKKEDEEFKNQEKLSKEEFLYWKEVFIKKKDVNKK
ncbi:MAG: NYN domain-containing protein [Leptospiraceae bacterium]|nr:NYN domain-containing protein [Leptospiraceae bacterium]MCP5495867.1 NYN domain-containing protein [Leptospiraceae bacterium]